ncbi:hypothetical protein ANCCAN_05047 [Ancylostoma caninum]|uniref:Uncharacterized protein n=1 Tax=Ancylostoma caninum TaxID=29170 RepID=A0A368GZH5_ANCCA|nr:hypothetical protein ANCCAN_05047 [Ancylostoma caninum]
MEQRVRKGPVAVGMAVNSNIYSYSEAGDRPGVKTATSVFFVSQQITANSHDTGLNPPKLAQSQKVPGLETQSLCRLSRILQQYPALKTVAMVNAVKATNVKMTMTRNTSCLKMIGDQNATKLLNE